MLGMVAVAPDHALQLAQPFGAGIHHARLAHHQHAQLVAGVHQLRRRRIVRGAEAVGPHLLELLDAEILDAVGQRRTHAAVVLMVARAFDFDRLIVEEEPLFGVEPHRADAERRLAVVHRRAGGFHRGEQAIQIRLFDGPQRRPVDHHLLLELAAAPRRDGDGRGRDRRHRAPAGTHNAGNHAAGLGASRYRYPLPS